MSNSAIPDIRITGGIIKYNPNDKWFQPSGDPQQDKSFELGYERQLSTHQKYFFTPPEFRPPLDPEAA